ncbi:MAG: dihydroxy-acid dehydratase [Actinobacteria bacterium]|nr:dihydroxy-acid dehydratase [Actinomycetota bacterium]
MTTTREGLAPGDGGEAQHLRSSEWFDRDDFAGWVFRSFIKAEGFPEESFRNKPVIGIANTWSEVTNCNAHLRDLADFVKRGVISAGGFPLEFPVLSTAEVQMMPSTMMYRNLLAMDVEESLRAHPFDAGVLLTGCDKTTPGALMGALSADIPSLVCTGGPMMNGHWRGRDVGACTDCHLFWTARRRGDLSPEEHHETEEVVTRSAGHCQVMGTASTMASLTEALGMSLPGSAAIPAGDSRRRAMAYRTGVQAVALARQRLTPSRILTPASFDNAIRVLHAIGGSTNAVIHLMALAGRAEVDLALDRFNELRADTPWLVNLRPSGDWLMEEFFQAGGVPAVIGELGGRIDGSASTVTGLTVAENVAGRRSANHDVIRTAADPLAARGAIVVLRGNLCPDGAVIKVTAADRRKLRHRGPALVFDRTEILEATEDPDLDVTPDTVLIMRGAGPIGGPGMPESGHLPVPQRLLSQGYDDLVRISDARISGTAYGTVVAHVAPEAAIGGPLACVRNGDIIELDVEAGTLNVALSEDELRERAGELDSYAPDVNRGFLALHYEHALQADRGCDLDVLRGRTPADGAVEWRSRRR